MRPPSEEIGEDGIGALAELFEEALPGYFEPATLRAAWTVPGTMALVLRDGDQLLAGILFRRVLDEAEILMLASRARRVGHALHLLEQTRTRLHALGVRRLFLEVAEDNQAAINLYRRAGFRSVGRRSAYYRTGADALLFELPIG
jgi:ribosomal protein S18 acetylase RimI-like enzyme